MERDFLANLLLHLFGTAFAVEQRATRQLAFLVACEDKSSFFRGEQGPATEALDLRVFFQDGRVDIDGTAGESFAPVRENTIVLRQCVAGVGENESRLVQAVAAHHAADGVGDQLLHGVLAEAGPLLLFGELAAVAVGGVHREGDLLDGDVGGELVRQAVGVDEEAVVLLFEALHLGDGVAVLGDPGGVAGFEGGGGFGGGRQDGEGLEVPGAFVGVPVDLAKLTNSAATRFARVADQAQSGTFCKIPRIVTKVGSTAQEILSYGGIQVASIDADCTGLSM